MKGFLGSTAVYAAAAVSTINAHYYDHHDREEKMSHYETHDVEPSHYDDYSHDD